MEAKHTPGEWQVADFIAYNDNSRHLAVWKGEERVICLVSPKEKEDEQDLANAKLIAAAPEMLLALKAVITEYDNAIGRMAEAIPNVRKAIQKATK